MSQTDLGAGTAGEVILAKFDFANQLAVGETISTQTTNATVYSGTDSSPSNIVPQAATASGTIVTQQVLATQAVVGVIYQLTCTITTSLSQTLQLVAPFTVTPGLQY